MVIPLFVVLFFVGLTMQGAQLVAASPGAGIPGHMETTAMVRGQVAGVFAAACLDAAYASPGTVSNNLSVTLPDGVLPPVGSGCITTASSSGGRNVYAYVSGASGALGQMASDGGAGATWYRVAAAGQATNVITGLQSVIPQTIPAGSLLQWVQISK
ncbi:hypothetical protein [Burkholderia cenocepacia]|uniref:hypothetical protein n=1 Tax=Burkholderia cenocepacia TaxID=95486 RepID=UPI0013E04396|nr:hypothetical protein [Burkholderia cenocepacia]MCW3587385.1 hypothetical protein [Burkholderia cenocepacia]MCW3632589.1 hypothetical protein [Burkholderia cenocepacia]